MPWNRYQEAARARRLIQNVERQRQIWPCGSTWHKWERSLGGHAIGDILPPLELRDSRFMRSLLAASDDCIKVVPGNSNKLPAF